MIRAIADETTIHGIKEVYYGNWLSRVFYAAVFIFCSVMMTLQLKGLFEHYINESVGTRGIEPADLDSVDVPSFYYCHDAPFPNIQALRELLNTTRHDYMYTKLQGCVHSQVYDNNPNPSVCTPYLKYWKQASILQELLTSIVLPPEHGRPDVTALRKLRPYFDRKVAPSLRYYASLKSAFYAEMAKLEGRSLQQVMENQITINPSSGGNILDDNLSNEIHGVLVNDVQILDNKKRGGKIDLGHGSYNYYEEAYHYANDMEEYNVDHIDFRIDRLASDSREHDDEAQDLLDLIQNDDDMHSVYAAIANARARAHPTLSLDGVCWEIKPQSQLRRANDAIGRTEVHLVTHLGGIGPQLREIVYPRHEKYPYGQNLIPNDIHYHHVHRKGRSGYKEINPERTTGFKQTIVDAMKYMELHLGVYASHVSIAEQGGAHLSFSQKIRIDSTRQHVLIKYWTKKRVAQNRKGFPCRPAPWTTLDQAHCNQQRMRKNMNDQCEQYLPASQSFSENNITKDICVHQHNGLLGDTIISDGLLKTYLGDFHDFYGYYPDVWENTYNDDGFIENLFEGFGDLDFLKMDGPPRWHLITNLTESSPECPRPCTRSSYHFSVSYPAPEESSTRQCAAALAYFFVPTMADNAQNSGGTPSGELNNATYEAFTYAYNMLWTNKNPSWMEPPCSIVEFERAEVHGQISEEYLLYRISDLASNIGGTMGLWMGASVISFIQLFYIACLDKMFRKVDSNEKESDEEEENGANAENSRADRVHNV